LPAIFFLACSVFSSAAYWPPDAGILNSEFIHFSLPLFARRRPMTAAQSSSSTFQPCRHPEALDELIHDPYHEREKLSDPSVCSDCGAVYEQGRWQWLTPPAEARQVRCAACRRIREKLPAGYVSIEGEFAREHRDEVVNLARNLEACEKEEHPLQRIMAIEEQGDKLMITTTDIHLARYIGEALEKAYKGELDFQYDKEEYLLQVHWRR
jgi:hypothetical protein